MLGFGAQGAEGDPKLQEFDPEKGRVSRCMRSLMPKVETKGQVLDDGCIAHEDFDASNLRRVKLLASFLTPLERVGVRH